MIDAKKLMGLKEAARDMAYCIKPEMIHPIKEDDRGVVLEGERRREVFIQYHGDTNSETNQKSESIARYLIAVNPDVLKELIREIERLAPFENETIQWKNNHATEVERARILKERPDMPVERVKAYDRMVELENENTRLKGEIDSMKDGVHTRMMLDMIFANTMQAMQESQRTNQTLGQVFKLNNPW